MIRELACALLLFAGVVHASSVVCNLNHRCVYYHLCVDGFINTDGSGIIDPRTPEPVPDSVPYARCEKIGTVCCRHPDNPDGPDEVVDATCPFHHRCVSNQLCIDGVINTSGVGLIDVRVNENLDCTNPDYASSPAVCCRKPYPAESCPETNTCVPRGQCNGETSDPKGTYIDCFLDDGKTEVGVCCDPLGVRETCSSDGSLECVAKDQCIGKIPLHENGDDVECYVNSEVTGVCCRQPLETCPEAFVCLPDVLCKGEILDETGASVPYHLAGSSEQCLLSGSDPPTGICCTNPIEEPELPPASDGCGIRHDGYGLDTRIKNTDYQAGFGEFPWQSIIFFTNFTFKCGGSLISDQWLLTAAHCVSGFEPGDFQVRLGEWKVNSYDEPGQYYDIGVESITIHPDFNNGNLHNDIAVIKLVAPVHFTYHINTVCLPESGQVFPAGERCFAIGWGKDAFEGQYQVILKKVDLPLVEHKTCQEQLGAARLGYYFVLDKSFLCAGGEDGKDACTGDGGGPLSCLDPNTGRYVLAGITAWGLGCGVKDVPGVYVDVQVFRDWIDGIVGETVQTHGSYGRK
ncbi:phenoloxidase-activating factor 2-like [Panulirus ornatus]|uniref:phenoloxidase-activating factor 2-like n=1 Tax=Panulirus ornatus TaxID=150431 RepID=UPI003A83A844